MPHVGKIKKHIPSGTCTCAFERKRSAEKRISGQKMLIFVLILLSGGVSSILYYQSCEIARLKHIEKHMYDGFLKIDLENLLEEIIQTVIILTIWGKIRDTPPIKKYIIVPGKKVIHFVKSIVGRFSVKVAKD